MIEDNNNDLAHDEHMTEYTAHVEMPADSDPALSDLHIDTMTELQLKNLIHELQVHQLELSIQNEELRATQIKLAEARDQYVALYDRAPVAYLSLLNTCRIIACNLATSHLLGVPRNQLIGRRLQEFICAESQNSFHIYWQRLLRSNEHSTTELDLKSPFGILNARMESQCAPSDAISKEFIWNTALTDITEQKSMQRNLARLNQELEQRVEQRTRKYEESRQELDAILNAVADAVITFDGNGTITHVNRAAERLFEYNGSAMIGLDIRRLIPSSGLQQHDNFVQEYMQESQHSSSRLNRGQVHTLTRTGRRIPTNISIARIDHQEKFTAVLRDISEIKSLQRDVLKVAEDERSRISRELHDSLGQDLVGISMLAKSFATEHMINNSSAAEMASHCTRFSRLLDVSVTRLRQIIFDLAPLELRDGGLVDALQSLVNLVNETTNVKCSLSAHELPAARTDAEVEIQLLRIAREAVHNALKHASASHIDIRLQGGDQIRLTVADDGNGMPETGVTDPNSQGIRIMQYRANVLGGRLFVEPNVPQGTCVTCLIAKNG